MRKIFSKNNVKRLFAFVLAFMVFATAFPRIDIYAKENTLTINAGKGVKNVKVLKVVETLSNGEDSPAEKSYENVPVVNGKYELEEEEKYVIKAELNDPDNNLLYSGEVVLEARDSEQPKEYSTEELDGVALMGKTINILHHSKTGSISIANADNEKIVVEVFDESNGSAAVDITSGTCDTDFTHKYRIDITVSLSMNFNIASTYSNKNAYADVTAPEGYVKYSKTVQYEDVEDTITASVKKYTVSAITSSIGGVYLSDSASDSDELTETTVTYGTSMTVYVVPEALYLISKVTVNDVDVTSEVNTISATNIGSLKLSNITENKKIEVTYVMKSNKSAKTLADAGIEVRKQIGTDENGKAKYSKITPDSSRADYLYYYIPSTWTTFDLVRATNFMWNIDETGHRLSRKMRNATNSYTIDYSMHLYNIVDNSHNTTFSPNIIILKETAPAQITFDPNWSNSVYYISSKSDVISFTGTVTDNGGHVNGLNKTLAAGVKYFTYSTKSTYSSDLTPVITSDGRFTITLDKNPTVDTTYYFYAEDKCGNKSSDSKKIVVDNDAPVITSVSVDTSDYVQSGDDCYTMNDYVTVSVYVTDEKSGLKTVELYRDGTKLGITPEISNGVAVFKNVAIDHNGSNAFYAKAIDNLGNTTPEGTVETVTPAAIYYDNVAPSISLETEVYSAVVEENAFLYLNSDELNTLEFLVEQVVSGSKKASGIASMQVYINDEYQTEDAEGNSFAITDKTTKVSHKLHLEDMDRDTYTIRIQAYSMTGASNTKTFVIKNDKIAPVVDNNAFAFNKTVRETFVKEFLSEASTDYAFFAKEAFDMTFDVTDMISGINTGKIGYYFMDEAGEKIGEDSYDLTIAENQTRTHLTATISVPEGMKGYVRLFLEDNVGNQSVLMTKGIVVESQFEHDAAEGTLVSIAPEKTDVAKDSKGLLLFNRDTYVSVGLKDAFAGIQSVKWSITTEDNGTVVYSDEVFVDAKGVISTNTHGVDWQATEDGLDQNLVTAMMADIPVTVNSNNIKVTVTMTDNAGNVSTESYSLSVDKTAPVVDVVFNEISPKQNNVFNANRVATVTIYERNFNDNLIVWDIAARHGNVASVRFVRKDVAEDPDKTAYVYEVVFSSDDDYDFTVSCKDMANLASNVVTEKTFTIDKTAPVITIDMSGNAVNDKYFATDRTATITVVEHNFDAANFLITGDKFERATVSQWQTTGDTHVITVLFSNDDVYTLNVTGMDMGGNEAAPVSVAEFVIDKTTPQFTFTGVTPNSANKGTVAPGVVFDDTNFDVARTSIRLVGDNRGDVATGAWSADQKTFAIPNIEEIQANDDIYTLYVTAVDMAGNTKTESIRFSANRFGSTYSFDDVTRSNNGKYVQSIFDVVLTEVNVDELDMETVKLSVSFNGSTTDLKLDEQYKIEKGHVNGGWCTYVYTIDKEVFAADGAYTIRAYSVDAAGNKNDSTEASKMAEISFGVDRTKPMIKALNLESNGRYAGKSYRAKYQLTDNLSSVGKYEVFIDGEEVEAIVEGDMIVFDIPESSEKHSIEIVAYDMAGNKVDDTKTEVLVNDHALVRAFGSVQAATAAAAAGGTVVVGGGTATGLAFRKRRLLRLKTK